MYRLIRSIYMALFLAVSLLILFIDPFIDYYTKRRFLFPNATLLLMGVGVFSMMLWGWMKIRPHASKIIGAHADHYILFLSVLLLGVQIYISRNIYFATGWDVGHAVIPAAKLIAAGDSLGGYNQYFSRYPNNAVLVWIFSQLIRFKNGIPFMAATNDLAIIIAVNCLISSMTGILLFRTVKRLASAGWALFSWGTYVLLVGLSPWMVITYSDALALLFPILVYTLYTSEGFSRVPAVRWFLVGLSSILGSYIKPQVVIILIAILVVEALKLLPPTRRRIRDALGVSAVLLLSFVLSAALQQWMVRDADFQTDREAAFGWSHFMMMGLNEENDGVYLEEDVAYSGRFPTAMERKEANLREIRSRLDAFGALGYLEFLGVKTLVNYGDGTFAWGLEGRFYMEKYEDKDPLISPLLKSFYYDDGKNYAFTSTVQQALWVLILVSLLGVSLGDRSKPDPRILVLMLSLIGLTLFELIFEARARYLYLYSPVYITLSVVGMRNLSHQFWTWKNKHAGRVGSPSG